MTLNNYLDLGDKLIQTGKFEEMSFAISFLQSERQNNVSLHNKEMS